MHSDVRCCGCEGARRQAAQDCSHQRKTFLLSHRPPISYRTSRSIMIFAATVVCAARRWPEGRVPCVAVVSDVISAPYSLSGAIVKLIPAESPPTAWPSCLLQVPRGRVYLLHGGQFCTPF